VCDPNAQDNSRPGGSDRLLRFDGGLALSQNAVPNPSTSLRFERISGALGAEVSGVDLSLPLSPALFEALHDGWMEHQVLFFRDQPIGVEQHKQFGRRFGELHVHPVLQQRAAEGHPEIVVLESDADRRFVAERWHSDVTFQSKPPLGSILRAVKVPDAGGDTQWSSMYAAYEALSETLQRLLSDLRALHHGGGFRYIAQENQKADLESDVSAVHPVIRTHPVTGRKGIFVNSTFTKEIVGMKPEESRSLLGFLYTHVARPEFTCRFRWRNDSIAMWDNRCTQHSVVPDNLVEHRRMERVTIIGDAPR
jgi:taurine dioxygenase